MSKKLLLITLLIFGWLTNEVQTQSEGAIELDNGILRVYNRGSWGFVCGTGWDDINSDVVCKILGYGSGEHSLLIPRFVFVTEIDNVRCRGYETNILNCTYTTLPTSCQQLINITCQYDDGDLRLPNKSNNGLLEIFYQDKWAPICDDFWSLTATDVACKKLGFRRAESFSYGVARATNEFHIDDIICIGNESSLLECDIRNGHDCLANEHIEIHCKEDGCESYAPFADANSTVVEFYSESNWFYICSEGFTLENANVTCRENTQSTVEQYSSEIKSGVLDKEIFPYLFRCNGDEDSLCACNKYRRISTCPSSSIVRIKCRADEGKLTLIPGTNKHNGFVFINHLEQWKGICLEENSNINFLTAHVACKQLGHKGVYNFYSGPSVSSDINRLDYYIGNAKTFSWIMYPNCTGKESSISECRFSWTESFCGTNPLWVDCEPYKLNDVIFTRSSSDFQGVPNIFYNDNWYKLCIINNAIRFNVLNTVCRSIGASQYQSGYIIQKSGNRFLTSDYVCFGDEDNLQSCYAGEVNATTCENGDEVYLVCIQPSDETPSLSYGSSENGIVDIYASNSSGLACINSQMFSQRDVSVICNDLGLNGGKWNIINDANNIDRYYWNSSFNCNGNEMTLFEGNCLEISEPQRIPECRQPFSPLKVYCRPSFNEMRLIPSSVTDGYYKVQILSPQRIWAPICSISHDNSDEICKLFGFETTNGITGGNENSNIFVGIKCNSNTHSIGQCEVAFTYDYMSILGCQQSLEVSCNNSQVPRFHVENLKGIITGPYSVLLRWDYNYPISEENMNLSYHLATNTSETLKEIKLNYIDQNVKSRYYSVGNLRPYAAYTFRILLKNSVGYGPQGESLNIRTDGIAPSGPPLNIRVTSIEPLSIELEWEQPALDKRNGLITKFDICFERSITLPCDKYFITQAISFQFRKTGLQPNTTYGVKIRAINSIGVGPFSVPLEFATAPLPPASPPILVNRNTVSIKIRWEEYIFPVLNYSLCVTKSNEIGCVNSFTTSNTSFLIPNLEPETEYFVTSAAVTEYGPSPTSEKQDFMTASLPQANPPSLVNASADSIEIRWDEYMFPVSNYTLCVRKSIEIDCENNFTTSNMNFLIQNLEPETEYFVIITANTEYGPSHTSERRGFTTEPLPSSIRLTLVDRDAVSIEIEWQEYLFPVLYYSLCVTKSNEIGCNNNFTTFNTSFLIQDLEPETEYFVTVSAFTEHGPSPKSSKAGFTTESLPQANPPIFVNRSANSLEIRWNEYMFPVLYYSLCVVKSNGIGCDNNFTTSNTNFLVQDLEPETEYSVTVEAVTGYGSSPASERRGFITEPLPAPIQPTLVDRDADSIEIEWLEYLFPVLNYSLCVTKSNEISCNVNFTTSNTSFLIQNLEPETEYSVTIAAVTEYGSSPTSIRQNFMTAPLPQANPPSLVNASADSIEIRWEEYIFPVLHYLLCVTKSNEIGCINSFTTSNTSFLIPNLEPETEYFVTSAAVTEYGPSPTSEKQNFMTAPLLQANPPSLVNASADSIEIKWEEYMFPVSNYSLCVRKSIEIDCGNIFTTSNMNFLIQNLEPETEYFVIITAITEYGSSPTSERRGFTTEPLPSPIQPILVNRDADSIEIEWQEYLFPVLHYSVCVTKSNEIGCNNNFTTSNTSFLIQDLEPETAYFVTVSAFTEHGPSPKSSKAGFATEPLPQANPPIFVNRSANSLEIRWNEYMFPVLYYSLCVVKSNGIGCDNNFTTSNTNFLIQYLEPETEYSVTVEAVTGYGSSPASERRGFITETLPSPIQPILVDRDASSVEIEWQEYLFPVSNYSLCVTKSNEIGCNINFTTSNTSFLIQNLEPETEYFVTISAVTEYGPSPKSRKTAFTTAPLPPASQPILVNANAVSIKIRWEKYEFPVSYYSIFVEKSNKIIQENNFTISINTSFLIQDLEPETAYFVTISAVTEYGPSPTSERRGFVTESLPLVSQPILVNTDAVSIEIEWQEYMFPVSNYLLCVTKTNEIGCKDNFTTSNTSFLIQDLEPETEYFLTIAAVTGYGLTPTSVRSGFTTASLPQANPPSLVNASANSIEIRWEEYMFPVSNYSLCVRKSIEIDCENNFTTSNMNFLIQNLKPETEYFVIITAITEYGSSPTSESRRFTTEPLPSSIRLTLVDRDAVSIEIEWQEYLFPVLYYSLCVTKSNEIGCNNNFTTFNTSFLIQDLEPETEYFVTVSAFTEHGPSPKSSKAGFTTESLPQANPPIFVNRSANSLEIRWNEYMFPVLYYSLCVVKSNGIGCDNNFTTSNTNFLIQYLEPETEYSVTVEAVTGYGSSPASERRGFITETLPSPIQPILVDRDASSVEIEWQEYLFPVSNYSLCVTKSNEIGCNINFTTSNTSFLIQNLEPETEYFVTISAVTEYGPSPKSRKTAFTTAPLPPASQPILVNANAVSIKIRWEKYEFPVSYYSIFVEKSNKIIQENNFTISINTSFLIQDLEPETAYFVTISAVTEYGPSPTSERRGFVTESLPLVSQPILVNTDADSIEIEWQEYMFPVSNYLLCVTKSNEIGCKDNFTTSNTSFLIQDLEPETEYFLTIAAVTGYGLTPTSVRSGFTTASLPQANPPSLVNASADSIELRWEEYMFHVSNYSLCVRKSIEIDCENNFTTSNMTFLIQNLEPETEYFVIITAITEYGPSPTSESRRFTTEPLPSPIQPTLVDRDAVSVEIEWQEYLFPVSNYSLCVTKSNEIGCNNNFTTSNTSFLMQDLEPETEYFVTISAFTKHGPSPKSNKARFTTAPLPPASPPILVNRNTVSIKIRWEEYIFPVLNYSLCVTKSNEIGCINSFTTSNTSFLIPNLEPETEYFVTSAAVTEYGPSPTSEKQNFMTASLPQANPPSFVNASADSIEIKWEEYMFPVSNYSLCVRKSIEIDCENIFTTSNMNFLIQNLEPETEYFVIITAITEYGSSPTSESRRFTTAPLPSASQPFLVNASACSMEIGWKEYKFPVLNYLLCVAKMNDGSCETRFIASNTSFLIQDLEPETEYFITIAAVTKHGPSPTNAVRGVTEAPFPQPSQPTLVDGRNPDNVMIEWEEYNMSTVLHYSLCVTKLNEIGCEKNFTTSNTTFLIEGLRAATNYSVTIVAVTETCQSLASNRLDFTTAPLPQPNLPNFAKTNRADSIKIEWEEYMFPVIRYSLCVIKSNEIGCRDIFTTSETSYTLQNLELDTNYSVTITAFTDIGESPASERIAFAIAPLPQPNLPNFAKTNRADSIKIEWEEYMFPVIRYSLCVIKSNEIGCRDIFTTSETSYTLQNLELDTNYSVTITAFTDVGESPASERIAFTIVLPLPRKPRLASVSKNSAKIEWEEYSFLVSSYTLCYMKLDNCETIPSNTFFTIEDLEPETEYSVTITAITEPNDRPSPPSEALIFETPRENKPPTITSPAEDIERIITDITTRTNFNLIQECIATGFPQPTVTWSGDLSMKFIIGNVLSIKPGDLVEIKDINPLRFICNATNSEGSDTRNVNILVRIDITDIIAKLINVTDENATNLTNIITTNTNGVNASAENTTEIRQDLEIIAKDFNNLVDKYLITSKSVSNSTVINLLDTAQAIISKDSNIEEEEIKDEVEIESNVAPASPVLLTTLSTVENIASNAAQSLEDSENDTSLIYRARTITVIAQNINLPKVDSKPSNLIIPKEEKGIEDGIEERIQIPSENFGILSSNNRTLRIATTIVDTMEIRSETKKPNSPKLFSNIISLVIPSKTDQKIKLTKPVKLIFPVPKSNPNTLEQVCSFLDDAYWSDEGLRTDEMNNVTDCYTDHLTSFAVFVTPRGLGPDNRIASIVSYAVVSISFISLIVSLVLFILSGKKFFKVEANIVYFNYCLSLTLAFGLFLFGIETGKFNEILCKIIAFLLHYLWLSVFVWTLCNGILIIYKLTLGIMRQQKIYPYLIVFGWTFPIIIPIITVAIKHDKYVNTAQHCFLTYEDGIIWAFIAPIIAIILVNMVILIVSVIRISTTKFGSEKLKEKQVIKTALVSTLILTPLLGIPWIILILNIFIVDPIVQWGFIITNGLMGIFFFFAITMRNAEVKKFLKKKKKGEYSQVSVSTENKSSSMLSNKFKRPVSRDATETLSPSHTESSKKGNYFALERMGTSEVQDDGGAVKSLTESISSRYNTPPRPKNLPKPKSKSSRDESGQETRYDIPVTVKPDQPNIYHMLKPKDAEGEKDSPVYAEIPEESSFSGFEYPSDATGPNKSVEVDKKVYQSLNQ